MKSYFSIDPGMSHSKRLRRLQEVRDLSPMARRMALEQMSPKALEAVEPALLNDARMAASKSGRVFEHNERDRGGRLITTYEGDPNAWLRPFKDGGLRVSFNKTPGMREVTTKVGPGQRVVVV